VWRLLGPGTDSESEMIRPRCALRRGAAAGWKHGLRLTSFYKLEESQRISTRELKNLGYLGTKKKKSKTKSCSSPPNRGRWLLLLMIYQLKPRTLPDTGWIQATYTKTGQPAQWALATSVPVGTRRARVLSTVLGLRQRNRASRGPSPRSGS
jgi:hypothetical protein